MTTWVRDSGLWPRGQEKIDWARRFMPVTTALGDELHRARTVAGLRIGLSLVLEPKTANLALSLARAGADVSVVCRAVNTRDDIAAALVRAGICVFARSDADSATERRQALEFVNRRHHIIVDDGARMIRLAHAEHSDVLDSTIGASEETTSGLRPLREMEREGRLRLPVIAANDARSKTLFDNEYGTGQSTVCTIADLLGVALTGKLVAVAGYGYVGRGVARSASALGATVTVAEIDPVKALEAVHAGYRVAPLAEAAADADLLISATGFAHTVDIEHLLALPDGAAVAVAGGVDQEIAIAAVLDAGAARRTVADRVEQFLLPNGRTILVLDNGGCINCTAGEGNPIEIMDLSFGVQLLAVEHLATRGEELAVGVHPLPDTADARVARAKLDSAGIRIDIGGQAR
ncbi:adenosylhomocysteinase [Nocardia jinanensis]|uniref:Adenosylhomocysteinase n=1 Tax=Nocardia jinanensis TaxID=382504 RepID=A0A917R4G9_9NOCA|nr:adenosylhomocysteinase [Nocardia jinanensis]GGK89891.1 adenosylhomocysteinase [Nocardia jinanensis]